MARSTTQLDDNPWLPNQPALRDWNYSDDQRNTTGWVVFSGSTPISWTSRLQQCTAHSTAQSKCIFLSSLAQECVYLKMFFESLKCPTPTIPVVTHQGDKSKPCKHDFNCNCRAIRIWCDPRNAVIEGNHPDNWISDELRHIKTSYHFFRQYVQSRDLDLVHVPGDLNCVDCLTKGYSKGTKTELNQKAASSIPPTRRPHLGQTKSSQHPI